MDLVNKDLSDLDNKIKLLRDFDERFLKIIEYESTLSDGLLSEILNNIYSGFYDSSADKLFSLLNNVKEFTEEKSE